MKKLWICVAVAAFAGSALATMLIDPAVTVGAEAKPGIATPSPKTPKESFEPDARFAGGRVADNSADLESGFRAPPVVDGPWVYWRWSWSYAQLITKQGITDDLEAMRQQGIGGVMVDTIGTTPNPEAAPYMSDAWLALVKHAHSEANRLGLGFYIHDCDGWANSGGPWITPENAMKVYIFSKTQVKGPIVFDGNLPQPDSSLAKKHPNAGMSGKPIEEFYRDVVVLAYDRSNSNAIPDGVINLTDLMTGDGHLRWQAPAGDWTILRFGWKITGRENSPASPAGNGLECDKLGARGIDAHLKGIAPILDILSDNPKGVNSLIGVDSWECGDQNWTQSMPEEFKAAKGYDLIPWLPVLAGDCLSPQSARFQRDFEDMIQEMVHKNYMARFTEKMHERGIITQCQTVPESSDIPCGEYWAESPGEKRYGPKADFFNSDPRRALSAVTAITIGPIGRGWGNNLIGAESFTSRCQNWERTPYALKSGMDWALCSGINKNQFHLYAIQPDTHRKPHYMEHGTAVNRNLTWWKQAHAWFDYIARSQFMLQRGAHVSDVCFVGDQTPWLENGQIHEEFPTPYRFDVVPWPRLINEMSLKNGEAVFAEGMAYKLIVLPNRNDIRLAEVQKIEQLLSQGATVLAQQKPAHGSGLAGFPDADAQIQAVAGKLWGKNPGARGERRVGKGRLIWGCTPEQALTMIGVKPDFNCRMHEPNECGIDWQHRRDGNADIYFVVNRAGDAVNIDATFRVANKAPELWNPDSTEIIHTALYDSKDGVTTLPLRLEPYESVFVVFRKPTSDHIIAAGSLRANEVRRVGGKLQVSGSPGTYELISNKGRIQKVSIPAQAPPLEIAGGWDVQFLDGMGAPKNTHFAKLESWTARPERDIKYYSGSATYTKVINVSKKSLDAGNPVLDLGEVRDLVDVNVNGKHVGTLWKPPYRISLKGVLKLGENELEITVANTWLNRFVGDLKLHGRWGVKKENGPRYTEEGQGTDDYSENTPILESGLLGPVRLMHETVVSQP